MSESTACAGAVSLSGNEGVFCAQTALAGNTVSKMIAWSDPKHFTQAILVFQRTICFIR
jgi:hypothetical protein